jgi:hypothetical protein
MSDDDKGNGLKFSLQAYLFCGSSMVKVKKKQEIPFD